MKRKQSRRRSFCFAVKKNKHLGQLTFQQGHTQITSFAHFLKITTENYNKAECKWKTRGEYNRTQTMASCKFDMGSGWATPDSGSQFTLQVINVHLQSFFPSLTISKLLEANGSVNLLKRRRTIKTNCFVQTKKMKTNA